jgi:hypothetical protein
MAMGTRPFFLERQTQVALGSRANLILLRLPFGQACAKAGKAPAGPAGILNIKRQSLPRSSFPDLWQSPSKLDMPFRGTRDDESKDDHVPMFRACTRVFQSSSGTPASCQSRRRGLGHVSGVGSPACREREPEQDQIGRAPQAPPECCRSSKNPLSGTSRQWSVTDRAPNIQLGARPGR